MRKSLLRVVAALGVLVATVGGAMAQQGGEPAGVGDDAAERAALRTLAGSRIQEMVEKRAVRPVDPAAVAEEARRIARRLSDEQLRALAADESVETVEETIGPSLITAAALGAASTDLTFVPLPPCRIIDTRSGGGILAAGETRHFQVAGLTEFGPQGGTLGGCGVPPGGAEPVAPAVMINLVAVDPTGKGNLAAWAFGQPEPLASSINFQRSINMNIANGLIVPIAGTTGVQADLSIKANFSAAHIVADVTGYFTRFPIEQFEATQKTITEVVNGGVVDLSAGLCTAVSSCTITSGATGKVIVRAWTQIQLDHGTNVGGDRIAMGVKNADPTNCTNNDQSINATDYEVPDALPAENDIDWTLSHKRIFAHGKGTRTYWINARMITGASAGDLIQSSRMICTFIPD
jgi:hypothetical protein